MAKKKLEDLRADIVTCGHCRACTVMNWHDLEEWLPSCPAGEYWDWESYFCVGRIEMARAVLDNDIENSELLQEIVYSCTTCGACTATCLVYKGMDTVAVIEALREEMVKREWMPPRHIQLVKDTQTFHNPYAETHESRTEWAPEDVKESGAKMAYFVGCTSSYREKHVAETTVEVLKKLGVNFTILKDEWCCGSPLLRTGNTKLAMDLAKHNMELLKEAGIEEIVFSCAGCYRTFREDYPEMFDEKLPFKVLHIVEYLYKLLKKGELKFNNPVNMKVTYHDPCHIGRHIRKNGLIKGIFKEPRAILNAIPGIEFVEMLRNKENAWCCGAGGGVKATFRDFAVETANERIKEAVGTGADALVSTCPFCSRNLMDAIKEYNHELEFYDLVELVNKAL
jgi:heterodisulfide reductase subunit D